MMETIKYDPGVSFLLCGKRSCDGKDSTVRPSADVSKMHSDSEVTNCEGHWHNHFCSTLKAGINKLVFVVSMLKEPSPISWDLCAGSFQ